MSEGMLWSSSDKKEAKVKRRRERRMARANYRMEYDLAYDGGGSAFNEYYKTRWGARIAAFFHLHVLSWGGSAELFPYPSPVVAMRHVKKRKFFR